ncbi:hypothetical protein [Novosphingobium beihaiensis]|uniref:Uncharacterized protein n=1 Tax=Novosphingobium beihaiensis TaxID=2930389 RepID=A0ABT0BN78_9SPHN|nr:hypothetical protein [Novosphingobium beihaiensis]MCJ2186502.1 hypothetical protein [Novosphingobium beihaiensis]
MPQLDKAEERAFIRIADARDAAEAQLTRAQIEDRFVQDPVVLDGLRRRPRYFDGRFLTGADLTRDQDYVRQRQADMARAGGAGVITGLHVSERSLGRGETLAITPGIGLTPSGDLVMLTRQRNVPLLDLPTSRQLDSALGLAGEPRVPLGRRSGLFVLALRPVEFTANPIAAYPRSVSGHRTVEDGDIIEASAITLIPYPDLAGASDLEDARRTVARAIFAGKGQSLAQDMLPLAMLALDRGTVRWIDTAMLRRETGEDSGLHVGIARRPRALAEAFLTQHASHLGDILSEMGARGIDPVFPAASFFSLLPPAGQMPVAAINADDFGFIQSYFPPGVEADLAFVPADEIPTLVEESLGLPPIDLAASEDERAGTGVTICVPVDRTRLRRIRLTLDSERLPLGESAAASRGGGAFDLVSGMLERRSRTAALPAGPGAVSDEVAELRQLAWKAALAEAVSALPTGPGGVPLVWYLRRRSIALQSQVESAAVAVSGDDVTLNSIVNEKIDRLKLAKRLAAINGDATPQAAARLMSLLSRPGVANSDVLTAAIISDVEKVIAADLPALPDDIEVTPAIKPKPAPAPTRVRPGIATAAIRPALSPLRINPAVLGRAATARLVQPGLLKRAPASTRLTAVRAGLSRVAAAEGAGLTTKARTDTELKLGEAEVMDVAQDYTDPHLGEGLARLGLALGDKWPTAKDAIWLGESGRALPLDLAFRKLPEETVGDFASLVETAVTKQSADDIDGVLDKADG